MVEAATGSEGGHNRKWWREQPETAGAPSHPDHRVVGGADGGGCGVPVSHRRFSGVGGGGGGGDGGDVGFPPPPELPPRVQRVHEARRQLDVVAHHGAVLREAVDVADPAGQIAVHTGAQFAVTELKGGGGGGAPKGSHREHKREPQSDPKAIPEESKMSPKMSPKVTPKRDPKMIPSDTKNDPK